MGINYSDVFAIVLDAVLSLAVLAFTSVVVPWLKGTAVPWLKEKRLYGIVQKFVNAAEKMADAGNLGKGEKKAYVVRMLSELGIKVDDQIDAMIESAVIELDIAFSEVFYEVGTVFNEDEDECDATQPEADCAVEECADA